MSISSTQVCEDLVTLLKYVKTGFHVLAEKHGLTNMQLYAMNAIYQGQMTMARVANSLHCDASNVTGIIDRLVAQGLVTRQEDPEDRRTKILQLTAKGQQVFDAIVGEMPAVLGCDRLTRNERVALHDLVARFDAGR
jgi:DNA-binding MarR family transcriptional regulator